MKKIKLKIICKQCGTPNYIYPPKKYLKRTDKIELVCLNCYATNNYEFVYSIRKEIKKIKEK